MKRRLLLVEGNKDDQLWMTEQLTTRFKSLLVTCVHNLDAANQAIVNHGCDIVLTDLSLPDGESPTAIIHVLKAYAPGTPIIALANMSRDDSSILDVTTLGIRDIIFKEDLRRDYAQLVTVIVKTIQDLASRDKLRDNFNDQVQALSHKVWDVDGRIRAMETILGTLTLSIDKMTQAMDKRGGLEDRIKELEKAHALGVRIVIGTVGLMATAMGTGITAVVTWFLKK